MTYSSNKYTQHHAKHERKKNRNRGPFPGTGFFFYVSDCRGTWPMKQTKNNHGQNRCTGPALGSQKGKKGGGIFYGL